MNTIFHYIKVGRCVIERSLRRVCFPFWNVLIVSYLLAIYTIFLPYGALSDVIRISKPAMID